MKQISVLFFLSIIIFLGSCANTTAGGVTPEVEPAPTPDVGTTLPEGEQIIISLDGVTSIAQEVGTARAGFAPIMLEKKSDASDFIGITTLSDITNPENTATIVDFDAVEKSATNKVDTLRNSLVSAFKDVLYGAGLETLTQSNVTVHLDETYTSAKVFIDGLVPRSEFKFNGPNPMIEINVVGDFTGYIDLTNIVGKRLDAVDGLAGIDAVDLVSDTAHEVSFTGADIFDTENQLEALKAMIDQSFIPLLSDLSIKTNFDDTSPAVVPGENKAYITIKLNPPEGLSFALEEASGIKSYELTINFTNEYGAFAGVLPINQSDIHVANLKPEVEDAMVIGSAGWAISGGSTPGGTRKIAVGEESSVSAQTVIDGVAAKLSSTDSSSMYEYAGVGSYTKDEATNRVVFPVTFEKKAGYLFYTGKPTHSIDFGYDFSVGALTVNDEEFADTLEALSDPDNIKALAGSSGEVTLEITENITNENGATPFEVNGGEEKLNLTFKATEGESVSVNGGDILTSLIVKGKETTVTVGEGITINGGYKDATLDGNGGGVTVTDGAHFILNGGIIEGNISEVGNYARGGGAVSVMDGTFTMNSGIIRDNKALRGAGVYVYSQNTSNPSIFIMNGGSIENNDTTYKNVGTATNNNKSGGGTGVFVYGVGASFTMNDGTIKGNAASRMGSAITISTGASVTINGGLITENIGPYGVIGMAANGNFTMSGGAIENNLYGPLNEDGTPMLDYIGNNDAGSIIVKWVNDIEFGIVETYGTAKLKLDITGGTIEGAAPAEVIQP